MRNRQVSDTPRCKHCLKPIVWRTFAWRPRWIHALTNREHCGMYAAEPME